VVVARAMAALEAIQQSAWDPLAAALIVTPLALLRATQQTNEMVRCSGSCLRRRRSKMNRPVERRRRPPFGCVGDRFFNVGQRSSRIPYANVKCGPPVLIVHVNGIVCGRHLHEEDLLSTQRAEPNLHVPYAAGLSKSISEHLSKREIEAVAVWRALPDC
jgi:hypothetical protein